MYKITTTRFNDNTYGENKRFRTNSNEPCIYGTSLKIKEQIPYREKVLVVEMNNQQNKIMGIGLIKNKLIDDKRYNIYADKVYNRYIYKGTHYLDIEEIDEEEKVLNNKMKTFKTIEKLELLLFKGARHSKRAQGITILPEWIEKLDINFKEFINNLFNKYVII